MKRKVVWGIGGGGGLALCWCLHLAHNPDDIDKALNILQSQKKDPKNWEQYEIIPETIGYLPSGYWINTPYNIQQRQTLAKQTIDTIFAGPSNNIDVLLYQRLKYYAMSHHWNKTWVYRSQYQDVFDKDDIIEKTNILFTDSVFLCSPPEFTRLARKYKGLEHQEVEQWRISSLLPNHANVVYLEDFWNNGNLIDRLIDFTSVIDEAVVINYVDAWIDSQPNIVRDYIDAC